MEAAQYGHPAVVKLLLEGGPYSAKEGYEVSSNHACVCALFNQFVGLGHGTYSSCFTSCQF
jgi:hypothetical protein